MQTGIHLTETLQAKRKAKAQRDTVQDLATLNEYELVSLISTLQSTVEIAQKTLRYRRLSVEAR